ncbi:MAG: OB-fold domain-containing protein [Alphaproteobacteria bacterium]|jgi:hypothetical protein
MSDAAYDKPMPPLNRDSKPYWDSLQEGSMRLQSCAECGKVRHYPRPVCDSCHSFEVEWVHASGKGKVHSWTVSHHPFHPGFIVDLPMTLVTVDLEEGVRMCAQMHGVEPDQMSIDMPVELGYEAATPDLTLPVFRPVT